MELFVECLFILIVFLILLFIGCLVGILKEGLNEYLLVYGNVNRMGYLMIFWIKVKVI